MRLRIAALIVVALDTVGWGLVAAGTFLSKSDAATKGLDQAAGYAVTILFLATAVPALVLAWRRRAPRLALTLALAFPAIFVLLFVGAVIAFA